MTPIEILTLVLVVAAILPLADFIYRYHRYSPYKLNTIGKTLMQQKWALLSVFVLILAARLFGEYFGKDVLTLVLFAFLVSMFYRTNLELRHVQRAHKGFDRYRGSSEKKILVKAHRANDAEDLNRLF